MHTYTALPKAKPYTYAYHQSNGILNTNEILRKLCLLFYDMQVEKGGHYARYHS